MFILLAACANAAATLGPTLTPNDVLEVLDFHAHAHKLFHEIRSTHRFLKTVQSCSWNEDQGKCQMSAAFGETLAKSLDDPELSKLWSLETACSSAKTTTACGSVPDCNWSDSECHLDNGAAARYAVNLYARIFSGCGAFGETMKEAYICISKSTPATCTGDCMWNAATPGKPAQPWEPPFGLVNGTCASVPTPATPAACGVKTSSDPQTAMYQSLCGTKFNMHDVSAKCAAKVAGITDPTKKTEATNNCLIKTCPMLAIALGGVECLLEGAKDEDTCKSTAWYCDWKNSACTVNTVNVLDKALPDSCAMKPMLESSLTCQQSTTAQSCDPQSCAWTTQTDCETAGAPQTVNSCSQSADAVMMSYFGYDKYTLKWAQDQQKACNAATSDTTCAAVSQTPNPKPKSKPDAKKGDPVVVVVGVTITIVLLLVIAVVIFVVYKAMNRTKKDDEVPEPPGYAKIDA